MMFICTKNLGSRLDLYIAMILNGSRHHSQILLTTCSSISKKPVQERDENQVWAALPGWVVYGAN